MAMSHVEFMKSLEGKAPPAGLTPAQQALWHAKRGDWDQAHQCAQEQQDRDGAWVHAHLHRVEGDVGNAGYWYRRANKPRCELSLEEEWEEIVAALFEV
jgi:hypothetical protein